MLVKSAKAGYVDELKRCINNKWAVRSHAVIEHRPTGGEWCQRLRACVRAGGYIKHML